MVAPEEMGPVDSRPGCAVLYQLGPGTQTVPSQLPVLQMSQGVWALSGKLGEADCGRRGEVMG